MLIVFEECLIISRARAIPLCAPGEIAHLASLNHKDMTPLEVLVQLFGIFTKFYNKMMIERVSTARQNPFLRAFLAMSHQIWNMFGAECSHLLKYSTKLFTSS